MNTLTYFFYNLFTFLILPFMILFFIIQSIFKPEYFKTHLQRLGFLLPKLNCGDKKRVWIHAVSVGEVASCEKIIKLLINNGYCVCLSTTTPTGYIKATKMYSRVNLFYYPLDYYFAVKRFVNKIAPYVFILVEMEYWPLMMHKLNKRGIPIFVISARVGDIEYRNMKLAKSFFQKIFSLVNTFYVQSEYQAERIRNFYNGPNIKIMGSLKFDVSPKEQKYKIEKFLPDKPFICVVSTHRGEEELVISAFSKILNDYPDYSLVIAPRHTHRAGEITRICKKYTLSYKLRTDDEKCSEKVFVIDTIGELMGVFPFSDYVIMGGSFTKRVGGHNIIEPALCKKACICGLHMQNFRDILFSFKRNNAIIQTPRSGLYEKMLYAIENPDEINVMSENAYNLIFNNKGVSEKIFREIFSENK